MQGLSHSSPVWIIYSCCILLSRLPPGVTTYLLLAVRRGEDVIATSLAQRLVPDYTVDAADAGNVLLITDPVLDQSGIIKKDMLGLKVQEEEQASKPKHRNTLYLNLSWVDKLSCSFRLYNQLTPNFLFKANRHCCYYQKDKKIKIFWRYRTKFVKFNLFCFLNTVFF